MTARVAVVVGAAAVGREMQHGRGDRVAIAEDAAPARFHEAAQRAQARAARNDPGIDGQCDSAMP